MGDARFRSPVTAGIRERLLAIRSIGLFGDLDDDGARLLTEHARLNSFAAGALVTAAGSAPNVNVIIEGSMRIGDEPGIVIGPGRPIGVIRLFSDAIQGPSSTALVPTRTLEIPGDVFLAALEENFSLWRGAMRLVSTSLLDMRGPLPPAPSRPPPTTPPVIDGRPRTLVERALELASVEEGMFTGANIDAVFDVARILREVHVPAGHVFWRIGEPARTAIRTVLGAVRCIDAKGNTQLIGPEYMLGALAAQAGRAHAYEARAETDVSAYEVAFEDWLVVMEAHPELAMRLLTVFTAQLAQALGVVPPHGEKRR
jgi:CRP-like cAMP-binding protein